MFSRNNALLTFVGLSKSNIITKTILGRPDLWPNLGEFAHANRLDASIAMKYGKMMFLLSFWITVTFA